MFKDVRLRFSVKDRYYASAWFSIPTVKIVSENGKEEPKMIYHPTAQEEWEEFINFGGGDIGNLELDDVTIDDPIINYTAYTDRFDAITSFIGWAIARVDLTEIRNITDILDAYYDLFKHSGLLYDAKLWLRICRAADKFMEASNAESVNKILICLNDAKLWVADNIRGSSSIIYHVDEGEEFNDVGADTDVAEGNTDSVADGCVGNNCNKEDAHEVPMLKDPFEYAGADRVYAVRRKPDHTGIYSIEDVVDKLDEDDDGRSVYLTAFKVMYYDVTTLAEPVNVFGGMIFKKYSAAKDRMYSFCDGIGCEFYDMENMDGFISTLASLDSEEKDKTKVIEYGYRIIKNSYK